MLLELGIVLRGCTEAEQDESSVAAGALDQRSSRTSATNGKHRHIRLNQFELREELRQMASKKDNSESGAPRWTYAAATIVAVAGFVWGIISFFLTEQASSKTAPTTAAPSSVNISASGSVGVGTMSGGSIVVGTSHDADTPQAPRASK